MKRIAVEKLKHTLIRIRLIIVFSVFSASSFGASITSSSTGNWSATAWPNTGRTGTIRVVAGSTAVTGTGTLFTTEISVGNIIKNTSNVVIGTVASVADNTHLTLASAPSTSYTNISFRSQGVGSGDAITVSSGHTITVDGAFSCASVSFSTVSANTALIISNTNSLSVTGLISMARPSSGFTCTINVGAGSLSAGTLTMSASTISSGTRTDIITISTGTVTIAGTVTTGTTGCLITFTGAGTFKMGASFSSNMPTVTQYAGNTWNYYGANQTVKSFTSGYYNLILSGSGTKTTTGVTVKEILEIQGTATVSAALAFGADATLKYNTSTSRLTGSEWPATFSGTGGIIISNAGTITLNGDRTLSNTSLSIENGATLNTSSSGNYDLSVGGSLTNNGALSANGSIVTVNGDWINNNTFNSASSTVKFNGGQAQSVKGTGANDFYNFSVSNPSDVTIETDANISGSLSFTNGKVITGSNKLILSSASAVTGASSVSYVYGNLVKGIGAATTSKTFEIGDASVYAPVTVTFTGTTNGSGSIQAYTVAGDSPYINSSNINTTHHVNRYWSLENSGVTGFASYDGTYTFAAGDVDSGSDITSFISGVYSSSSWNYPETGSATSTTVQLLGASEFGVFQTGEPKTISGAAYDDNGSNPSVSDLVPCINIPSNPVVVSSTFSAGQYFTMNVIKGLVYQVYSCNAVAPSYPLMMTVYKDGAPSESAIAFSYSNTGNTCSGSANNVYLSFVPEFTGKVRILLNRKANILSQIPTGISVRINVSGGSNSADNQLSAGLNSWTGHIYDGTGFNNYLGYYTKSETFQESFGTGGTWPGNTNDDGSCFNLYSEENIRAAVLIATYSVRYRLISDKKGLFTASLTSDDGSRLYVNGNLVFSDWSDHSPRVTNNVLFNLDGNSELVLEYYENGGQNVIGFTNLVKIITNTVTPYTEQQLCTGGVQGNTIIGDVFGTLPTGITLAGTGYQWAYSSVSATGPWTDIIGATSSSFTPSSVSVPFNTPGTYYLIRKARLTSTNNISPDPYVAESESNIVIIRVTQGGKWLGISGSDWNTASNWCGGVPSASTNVTIASDAPNQPVISGTAVCNNITIGEGSVLTITAAGSVSINGSIDNQSGTAGIILKSDATGSASMLHNTDNVPATAERYITGSPEAWHLLSSPVSGQLISGDWLPSGTYGNGTGYDLYVWNEATNCWIYKLDITNTVNWNTVHPGSAFKTGKGYLYSVQAQNPVKYFTGELNNGTYTVSVSANSTNQTLKGLNLLGNPYPSSIDWQASSGWDRSVLQPNGGGYDMWIWNSEANNYGVINSAGGTGTNGVTRYIGPSQGFFVKAAENGNISTGNSTRVNNTSSVWLKKGTSAFSDLTPFSLTVRSEEGFGSDEVMLIFGTEKNEEGAIKLYSPVTTAPSLYFSEVKQDLSVKYAYDTAALPSVPVLFKPGTGGKYHLKADFDKDIFPTVILEDTKEKRLQNLIPGEDYIFRSSVSDKPGRFVLHFTKQVHTESQNFNPSVYQSGSNMVLDLSGYSGKSIAGIYDLTGRCMVNEVISAGERIELALNSKTQVLIVQLKNGGFIKTSKIMWMER